MGIHVGRQKGLLCACCWRLQHTGHCGTEAVLDPSTDHWHSLLSPNTDSSSPALPHSIRTRKTPSRVRQKTTPPRPLQKKNGWETAVGAFCPFESESKEMAAAPTPCWIDGEPSNAHRGTFPRRKMQPFPLKRLTDCGTHSGWIYTAASKQAPSFLYVNAFCSADALWSMQCILKGADHDSVAGV